MADKQADPNRSQRGTFLPGNNANPGGRPKGSRNAVTMTIKDGIEEAYHQLGGIAWLVELGRTEPKAFAALLAKLLPPTPPEDAEPSVIRIIGGFQPSTHDEAHHED
jgi:hypothetical protein